MMISNLMSKKYRNLPLFLLVEKYFWSSQGYHFHLIPHIEEEATMMMHNLIPVLIFRYRDNVKNNFSRGYGSRKRRLLGQNAQNNNVQDNKNMAEAE